MNKTLTGFAVAIVMTWSSVVSGDLIVEYDGLAASFQAPANGTNATGINLTRGAGIDEAAGTNFNSNNFGAVSLANAISANEYLSFGFTVNLGQMLSMSDILVEMDRSATGPDTVYLLFDADNNGFDIGDLLQSSAISDPGSIISFNAGLPANLTAADGVAEFRFYYTGATSLSGTTDIEDDLIGGNSGSVGLQLNGTFVAIPEPGMAIWLLAISAGTICGRRRRCVS